MTDRDGTDRDVTDRELTGSELTDRELTGSELTDRELTGSDLAARRRRRPGVPAPRRAAAAVVGLGLGAAMILVAPAPASAADDGCTGTRAAPIYVPDQSPALAAMAPTKVWEIATGKGVVVAVVDSGIDVGNGHLPADSAVLPGRTLLPPVQGWTPDPAGRNDLSGHGTAVASLIAGRPLQGSGQVGLAKDASLLPIQVFGVEAVPQGGDPRLAPLAPTTARLADGIRQAADLGAKVVNVSLSVVNPDPGLADAVAYAQGEGALVVASAGDRGTAQDTTDGPRYPAAFPGVVAVTSVSADRTVDLSANIQGDHITVAAVGTGLNAALGHVGDCLLSSAPATSFATPQVAALAALLAQKYPNEGPALWRYRIEASAQRPRADTKDAALGWGIVSPYDALTMTLDPNRPGPTMPGHAAPPRPQPQAGVGPVVLGTDPNAEPRQIGLWVAFLAVAVAVGLRLVQVLRRRPAGDNPGERLTNV